MRAASNPLCKCRKTGAYRTREVAEAVLARILEEGPNRGRMYQPTRVDRCPHGVWHLTSKPAKRWAKGKQRRRR